MLPCVCNVPRPIEDGLYDRRLKLDRTRGVSSGRTSGNGGHFKSLPVENSTFVLVELVEGIKQGGWDITAALCICCTLVMRSESCLALSLCLSKEVHTAGLCSKSFFPCFSRSFCVYNYNHISPSLPASVSVYYIIQWSVVVLVVFLCFSVLYKRLFAVSEN